MRSFNIRGKRRKNEQYHSYKGEVGKIADNILNRDFTASKPFEKLTTDVTQFKVCNDKVYLSPVPFHSAPTLHRYEKCCKGLQKSCPKEQHQSFTQTKVGSTNTENTKNT